MQDFGKPDRVKFLRECPQEEVEDSGRRKLKRAIRQLGRNWVMHPDYVREEHPDHCYTGSYYLRGCMNQARTQGRI